MPYHGNETRMSIVALPYGRGSEKSVAQRAEGRGVDELSERRHPVTPCKSEAALVVGGGTKARSILCGPVDRQEDLSQP